MRIGCSVVCQNGHHTVYVIEIVDLDARHGGTLSDCPCPKHNLGDGWRPDGKPFVMDQRR